MQVKKQQLEPDMEQRCSHVTFKKEKLSPRKQPLTHDKGQESF